MARRRRGIALVLAVACLGLTLVAGMAVQDDAERDGAASPGDVATSSPTPTTSSAPPSASAASRSARTDPANPTSTDTVPPGAPPSDGEEAGRGGIEAAPTQDQDVMLGDLLSEEGRSGRPIVRAPAGDDAAEGALVADHPERVLPLVPGSHVRTSSISTSAGGVQVAVVAAGGPTNDVLRFYRVHLASLGFREVAVLSVPGTQSAAFRWRKSSAVVTIGPEQGSYAVFATLQVKGS